MKRWLVAVTLAMSGVARAAIDTYELANDTERGRFRELTQQLRCPKCQNQNIADSNAPIATDLRHEIYRMLDEGKDNQQILDFMAARYGDFVLYKPALTSQTTVLWFGPFALFFCGLAVLGAIVGRHTLQAAGLDTLSVEARKRLDTLLDKTKDD